MHIGDFNRRCVLQAPGGRDEYGQESATEWVDVATSLPCNVLANTGHAQIVASADVSLVKASIRLRWRTDVVPGMRVVQAGTIFMIKAVLPDFMGRRYVDLACEVAT